MSDLHADELPVDEELVGALLRRALPSYAALPVRRLRGPGSTNVLFRLGDELVVRLPRQPGGSESIVKEQRWLPVVAPHLSAPVPEVVAVGAPDLGYPEHWSVTRWVAGEHPVPGAGGAALGRDLARVVGELREVPVPPAAAADPALRGYRVEPLHTGDASFRESLEECRGLDLGLDLERVLALWESATAASRRIGPVPPRWCHVDLLAENLLVDGGRLAGVLDFGGLAVGDPSVDLVVAWEVLDGSGRATFREALGVDDAAWAVGRGWALWLAVMTFPYYWTTMPERCAERLVMARAVLQEAVSRPS